MRLIPGYHQNPRLRGLGAAWEPQGGHGGALGTITLWLAVGTVAMTWGAFIWAARRGR